MAPTQPFPALVLIKGEDRVIPRIQRVAPEDYPDQGPVWIEVAYSSLNYKDGLAITDRGRIVRGYPIVPGVDLAGRIVDPGGSDWEPGQAVVVVGRGIGEDHWGGYSRYARVQPDWPVALPEGMSLREAMIIGTAGYTAMLSAMTLEEHGLEPGDGEVVVTGASGGVGSMAVAILAGLGHRVVASTGRVEEADYQRELGAAEVVHRRELSETKPRPLFSERWAGAVDNVGGVTLSNLIAQMRRHGTIASCGLAGGAGFESTVFPFILRGINLCGIDSNYCPASRRQAAWQRLARELPAERLERMLHAEIGLGGLTEMSEAILAGQVRGRVIVDLSRD